MVPPLDNGRSKFRVMNQPGVKLLRASGVTTGRQKDKRHGGQNGHEDPHKGQRHAKMSCDKKDDSPHEQRASNADYPIIIGYEAQILSERHLPKVMESRLLGLFSP